MSDDFIIKFESDFVTINLDFEDFADIKYALFSKISSKEENMCIVKKSIVEKVSFFEFISRPSSPDEEKKIKEYRDIAYSYLCFAGIPIIIQSPYESLELSYFIDVSSSPFQKNPGLARIVYPENIENVDIIFNPNLKFYNKMGDCFAKAVDGFNPNSNEYRVFFLHDINRNLKLLHHHPIAKNKIPGYANLITKENIIDNKLQRNNSELISCLDSKYKIQDMKGEKIFYATSYVDIGLPEETMIAASVTSNCLFLNPDHGQIKYFQRKGNGRASILRFLFRSKDYDDSYLNMLTFTAALASSTNIIIPFTVPCYDVVKMLSLFVENSDKFKNFTRNFQKKIIFFIDLQYEKGNKSTEFAADFEFKKITNAFSEMDIFKKLVKNFRLCKSVKDLVSTLRDIEEDDLITIDQDEVKRKELISSYNEIIDVLNLFLDQKETIV